MTTNRTTQWRRVWRTGVAVLGLCGVLVGCATTEPPKGPAILRPASQQAPVNQVVGEAIVASLGGAAVTVRWMDAAAVGAYYAGRQGLVAPWPPELWQESPPTIFLARIRNQTREEVQFDPASVVLVAQDGERDRTIPYEEMYMRLADTDGAAARLMSLQATLLSRFVVIQPGGEREGFLLFPSLKPEAVYLLLELPSFFVGGRPFPGRLEFQVTH
jgi:hypothetical protein